MIQGNIKWLKIKAKFQDGGRSLRSRASRINLSDSPAQRHFKYMEGVFIPAPSPQSGGGQYVDDVASSENQTPATLRLYNNGMNKVFIHAVYHFHCKL